MIAKAQYYYVASFFLTVSVEALLEVAEHAVEHNKVGVGVEETVRDGGGGLWVHAHRHTHARTLLVCRSCEADGMVVVCKSHTHSHTLCSCPLLLTA